MHIESRSKENIEVDLNFILAEPLEVGSKTGDSYLSANGASAPGSESASQNCRHRRM